MLPASPLYSTAIYLLYFFHHTLSHAFMPPLILLSFCLLHLFIPPPYISFTSSITPCHMPLSLCVRLSSLMLPASPLYSTAIYLLYFFHHTLSHAFMPPLILLSLILTHRFECIFLPSCCLLHLFIPPPYISFTSSITPCHMPLCLLLFSSVSF